MAKKNTTPLERSGFFDDDFRIYQQGGLDCFCSIYACINLINYFKSEYMNYFDYVGENDYKYFKKIMGLREVIDLIKKLGPLGGIGCQTEDLLSIIEPIFSCSGISIKASIAENLNLPITHLANQRSKSFRSGIDKRFSEEEQIFGLACIMEGKNDKLQHWISMAEDLKLKTSQNHRGGRIFDSSRNYCRWWLEGDKFYICRRDGSIGETWFWMSSFIEVKYLGTK